jgi:tartrate dehydrogenase/decarboxylase/D-malate dehydrogenase
MGKKLANPVGTIWSCVMMLAHLGEPEAGNRMMRAIEKVAATPELCIPEISAGKQTLMM